MRKRMISAVAMLAVLVMSVFPAKYNIMASTTGASGFILELEEENPATLVKGETYTLKISPSKTITNDNIYFKLNYDYDLLKIGSDIVVDKGWSQFIKIEVDEVIVQLSGDASALTVGEAFMEIPIVVREDVSKTSISLSDVNYDGKTYDPLVIGGGTAADDKDNTDDESDSGNKDNTGKAFELELKDVSAAEEAVIPLNVVKNTGIHALGITITYDPAVCSFDRVAIEDEFKSKITLQSIYQVPGEGMVGLSFLAKDTMADTGEFANIYFNIKDGVTAGTTSDLMLEITQAATQDETIVSGTKLSSKIIVAEEEKDSLALGDVNGDGKINLLDGMLILRYYNGEKTLTAEQLKSADTKADGTVNLLDALQILRYYNGELKSF